MRKTGVLGFLQTTTVGTRTRIMIECGFLRKDITTGVTRRQLRHKAMPGCIREASDTMFGRSASAASGTVDMCSKVLQCKFLVGYLFHRNPPAEATFAMLYMFKLVCRVWRSEASNLLKNVEWLGPFLQASAFVAGMKNLQDNHDVVAIVAGMLLHESRVNVQHAAIESLVVLAGIHDKSMEIVNSGGIERVIAAMTLHKGEEAVLQEGCGFLVLLAADTGPRIPVVAAGGVACVLRSSLLFPENGDIRHMCRIIVSCGVHTFSETSDMVTSLLSDMTLLASKPKMQNAAAYAIKVITSSPPAVVVFIDAGGLGVLEDLMEAHVTDEAVQQYGFHAIHNIIDHERHVMGVDRARLLAMVSAAMNVHLSKYDVQVYVCRVLVLICINRFGTVHPICTEGVLMLLANMKTHAALPVAQNTRSGVMSLLSKHAESRDIMIHAGCIPLVVATMNAFDVGRHYEVCINCSNVLLNICKVDGYRQCVVAHGGVEATLASMQQCFFEFKNDSPRLNELLGTLLSLLLYICSENTERQQHLHSCGGGAVLQRLDTCGALFGDCKNRIKWLLHSLSMLSF